ncbi:MAG: sigma-54-dependent Fis family transcriptional regulator [Acidobacteria bacterium]|nr:sigma-54-dependent Fis family transcriptional regulator [Acidobacteriota bacterium]MBV9068808.1 sigma-54-dependent Fis family transcriptional regulator [Acidobacteriota bacterium]MBV9187328.1 sigma-54-dependent Fis family transcriptional regulator [Acidobacteriota bacterium]
MATVLVVDDDIGIRESAAMALEKVGLKTVQAGDVTSALQALRAHRIDLVLSDIYMPGETGLTLLQAISERRNPPRVILMTARGTIETTALAQRIGAFDYIAKPFDLSELIARVRAALGERIADEVAIEPGPSSRIAGSHPSMIAMYKAIARVASLNVPVVILGESGSGKELVAQSIHDLGDRVAGPFIAINCGAIPDTLLENELFGSARGAFTDSRQDRRGALSRADGGTLFLDEIGDISPAFQVKLLRFLQDGVVTPLGAEKSHRVDVRLIAATHRDIKRLVAEGRFREDLYYRLAGYEIAVPPLRDRVSDIPLLVDHFKHRIGAEMKKDSIAGPSQSVLDVFAAHAWPGNVRELEQVIRRTVIDSGALVDAAAASRALRDIAPSAADDHRPAAAPVQADDDLVSLDEAEKRHIIAVLRATGGNQTQAAYILGIERKTLARKIKRLDISLET